MLFSYNAVWEDTVALLRRHGPLLMAIAGVFLFLPVLLIAVFAPPPEPPPGVDPARAVQMTIDYYTAAWPWFLLQLLSTMVGTLAMLRLVFARGTTVGGALAQALILTPLYFLVSFILGFGIGLGLLLFLLPGLYLFGRIVPAPAVVVVENRRSPFDIIRRTFAITRGHGWAILGLVLIVLIVGGVAVGVAGTLFGLVFVLAAGQELGRLLAAVVDSAFRAALETLLIMLYAAIYRALAGPDSVAAAFE
jgi:hypothetical protein